MTTDELVKILAGVSASARACGVEPQEIVGGLSATVISIFQEGGNEGTERAAVYFESVSKQLREGS